MRLISWLVLWIQATCLYGAAEKSAPDGLLPEIAPLPIGSYREIIVYSVLTVSLLLIFLFFLCKWIKKRRQKQIIPLTSFQQFLIDLHRAKDNIGDAKHFCQTLCYALKSYLQRVYQLPLTCRTTEEFLKLFSKSTQISWEQVNLLSDVLQRSDMSKFAGESMTIDEQKELFIKTCRFIRFIRRRFHKKSTAA